MRCCLAILFFVGGSGCTAQPPTVKIPVDTGRIICRSVTVDDIPFNAESPTSLKAGSPVKVNIHIVPAAELRFRVPGKIEMAAPSKIAGLKGKKIAFYCAVALLASSGSEAQPINAVMGGASEIGAEVIASANGKEATSEMNLSVPSRPGKYELRIWTDSFDTWTDRMPPEALRDLIFASEVTVE